MWPWLILLYGVPTSADAVANKENGAAEPSRFTARDNRDRTNVPHSGLLTCAGQLPNHLLHSPSQNPLRLEVVTAIQLCSLFVSSDKRRRGLASVAPKLESISITFLHTIHMGHGCRSATKYVGLMIKVGNSRIIGKGPPVAASRLFCRAMGDDSQFSCSCANHGGAAYQAQAFEDNPICLG